MGDLGYHAGCCLAWFFTQEHSRQLLTLPLLVHRMEANASTATSTHSCRRVRTAVLGCCFCVQVAHATQAKTAEHCDFSHAKCSTPLEALAPLMTLGNGKMPTGRNKNRRRRFQRK
ncbi:hypothetical protein GUJ93_ZPchr0005g15515 [Zizania palustris]|uniref:Uncharacterized protein n=1 Tax=Zizania palustris TaxID=103762 RepID=A0A8J5VRA6_ZIZPA|nr:hypothetical protein GUJ93_ZPchr0005g15515 [Zizania palustris]